MIAATFASSTETFSHHVQGLIDDRTVDAIVRLVHRETDSSYSHALALVLGAEELIVCRDAQGNVQGAHGFRFLNVCEDGAAYRVIYAVFSAADARVANRRSQFAEVAQRVFGPERRRAFRSSVVWAHAAECDKELAHCASRWQPLRRLTTDSDEPLLEAVRFFIDQFSTETVELLPIGVELAVLSVREQQQELEESVTRRMSPVLFRTQEMPAMRMAA